MTIDTKTGEGEYPKNKWNEPFRDLDKEKPKRTLFDPDALTLVTPLRDTALECPDLLRMETDKDEREKWLDKINEQAQGDNRIIQPVLDVLDISYATWPKVGALIGDIMSNIRYPLYRFKVQCGRARPHHKCSGLNPMYMPKEHPLHPGHGSFPGGHATFAYFWAEFLREFTNDAAKKQKMVDMATEVAINRERAGLHFESDTAGGRELGEKIARAMIGAMRAGSADALTQAEVDSVLNAR